MRKNQNVRKPSNLIGWHKNVWCDFKKIREKFPMGTNAILRLEPIEYYIEIMWANNTVGIVVGYNITHSLVIVEIQGVLIHCDPKLLEKPTFITDFDGL